MKNVRMPGPGAGKLARAVLVGGAALYGATNALFNVEGGHRAIVFNRLSGIKERVRVLCDAGTRRKLPLSRRTPACGAVELPLLITGGCVGRRNGTGVARLLLTRSYRAARRCTRKARTL